MMIIVTLITRITLIDGSDITHQYKKLNSGRNYNEILDNSNNNINNNNNRSKNYRNEFKTVKNEFLKNYNNNEENSIIKESSDKLQKTLNESNSFHNFVSQQVELMKITNNSEKASIFIKNEILENKTSINDDIYNQSTSVNNVSHTNSIINSNLQSNNNKFSQIQTNLIESSDSILKYFGKFLLHYLEKIMSTESYEPISGIKIIPNNNIHEENTNKASTRKFNLDSSKSLQNDLSEKFRHFIDDHIININVPRAIETGRLFFFKGM